MAGLIITSAMKLLRPIPNMRIGRCLTAGMIKPASRTSQAASSTVVTGRSGSLLHSANEPVKTAAGAVDTQKITVTPPAETGARSIAIWLSTDAARVPVKMSAQLPVGAFVLTLASRR